MYPKCLSSVKPLMLFLLVIHVRQNFSGTSLYERFLRCSCQVDARDRRIQALNADITKGVDHSQRLLMKNVQLRAKALDQRVAQQEQSNTTREDSTISLSTLKISNPNETENAKTFRLSKE